MLKHLHERMARDVVGAELLRSKPRIDESTINRNWLASLEDGTLGKEYLRFVFCQEKKIVYFWVLGRIAHKSGRKAAGSICW